jgi:[acyl-carrier-protein] S-malonyltransferase
VRRAVAHSGSIPGCEALEEIAKPNYKARMTVRLAVAGAFHTNYMSPAVDSLKEVGVGVDIVFASPLHSYLYYNGVS